MAKRNNSDYRKWARRKTSEYLKTFMGKNLADMVSQRLRGEPPGGHSSYSERKMLAAQYVLRERGEL